MTTFLAIPLEVSDSLMSYSREASNDDHSRTDQRKYQRHTSKMIFFQKWNEIWNIFNLTIDPSLIESKLITVTWNSTFVGLPEKKLSLWLFIKRKSNQLNAITRLEENFLSLGKKSYNKYH